MLAALYWYSPQRLPIVLAILAGAVALTWWLYPSQVSSLSRRWRWLLPMLRAGAMGALAISLLQPSVIRPRTDAERGPLLVLVDNSRSMSVSDTGRSPAQLIALASALGQLPSGVRDETAASLQADADQIATLADAIARQRSELDYARLAGRGVAAAQARLDENVEQLRALARSAAGKLSTLPSAGVAHEAMTLLSQSARPDFDAWLEALPSRVQSAVAAIEHARTLADEQLFRDDPAVHEVCQDLSHQSRLDLAMTAITGDGGTAAKLAAVMPVLYYAVGDRVTPFASDQTTATPSHPIEADGAVSNLTGAVRAVLDYMQGTPVRGVVLLSDGRPVGGDTTVPSTLASGGVPVYAVSVAPPQALKDAAVLRISAPSSTFMGETITVRADVRATGVPAGTAAEVTFEVGGANESKQTRQIALAGDAVTTVEFTHEVTATPAAGQLLTVSISPLAGEATTENNRAQRWLKVIQSDPIRIAAFAGSAGWDFQYVCSALSREPWCRLADGILSNGAPLPLSPRDILRQDVIMLFDVAVDSLDAAQWGALSQLVKDRGGSVILVAGDAHLPAEYLQHPAASALLPIIGPAPAWHISSGDRPGVHVIPSPGTNRVDALRLASGNEPMDRRWQQLPGMYRFLPISPLKPDARSLLMDGETAQPVLTESRIGFGRSFILGINETWRWRYKVGGRDQQRFWLQLLRYAAEEPYDVVEGPVALDADALEVTPSTPVRVRARVLGEDELPAKGARTVINVLRDGRIVRSQVMASADGRFTTTLVDLPEGSYQLQLDAGPTLPHPAVPLRVQRSYQAEMADLTVDDQLLRQLARASGGEFLRLDQIDTLPRRLTEIQPQAAGFVERTLWDSPQLYAFVVGCLGVEWALRKRFGLA